MHIPQVVAKKLYPLLMRVHKVFRSNSAVKVAPQKILPPESFHILEATANNGTNVRLSTLAGKKILVVNTASYCGYTAQYAELQELYHRYRNSLVILAFPSNDFKQQEPDTDETIAQFCKTEYRVAFPVMLKVQVRGGLGQHPVYYWLSHEHKNGWCNQKPVWNFCKYLIDEKGRLTHFFDQTVSPLDTIVTNAIES